MQSVLPHVPFPEFPLRPHRNRQWFKSIWNPCTKKPEQFYFGSWSDDPKAERAQTPSSDDAWRMGAGWEWG